MNQFCKPPAKATIPAEAVKTIQPMSNQLACAKACHGAGIEIYGYFMIGAPGETQESIEKTINLALKIKPTFAIFSKTILIPGSELFNYGVETGQIE